MLKWARMPVCSIKCQAGGNGHSLGGLGDAGQAEPGTDRAFMDTAIVGQ